MTIFSLKYRPGILFHSILVSAEEEEWVGIQTVDRPDNAGISQTIFITSKDLLLI